MSLIAGSGINCPCNLNFLWFLVHHFDGFMMDGGIWRTSCKEKPNGCVALVYQWSTLGHWCLKSPTSASIWRVCCEPADWTWVSVVLGLVHVSLSIASHISALEFQVMFTSGHGNMLGRVAHLWANIKPVWILQKRITHEETFSAQFWWMSQPLLFYSMVANKTDTVSWKEFVLPLRCEMHIDYGAPWVSCPWQGWYWLEPALAVNYGWLLPICLQLNYLYNGQIILRSL